MRRHAGALVGVAVFAVAAAVYVLSPNVTSSDSRWALYGAVSLARHGDVDLDEYRALVEADGYAIRKVDGHVYNYFPYGTSVLVAPVAAVVDLAWYGGDLEERLAERRDERLEKAVASVVVAAAAVVVYALALSVLGSVGLAAVAAGVFAFATPAWSTASRGLWMHGPVMLLYGVALLLAVRAGRGRGRPALAAWSALPLAFAFVVRPTAVAAVVAFTVWVAVCHRRQLPLFLGLGALVALAWVLANNAMFGQVVHPYYQPSELGSSSRFLEAVAGNLVSPGRGLFVFVPVGLLVFFRRRRLSGLEWAAVATAVVHLLLISRFWHWWGGFSFGPRLMSDLAPVLVFLLLPVLGALRRNGLLSAAFVVLTGFSVFVHWRGSVDMQTWYWNSDPVSVDADPSRVWDWRDPQFLR